MIPPQRERRRTRNNRAGSSLRWRISLVTQWKISKMPPPPGRRGTRRDAAAGEEGTRDSGARKYIAVKDLAPLLSGLPQRGKRSSGATKPIAAGDVARLLGEVAKKIVASEDFAAFPFLFPVGL